MTSFPPRPPSFPSADPIPVLAHARWIDGLARELVQDPALAADLAQETRLVALSAAPDPSRPLRGWLATVMRNLLRQMRRGEARRDRREALVASAELSPSGVELAARLEAHRRVVEAVARLEEPYRRTILLRYFEDLAPAAIAARDGVPVATVKTRLQRGLQLLRGHLDRDFGGDGRSWALALSTLVPRAEAAALLPLGALAVNVKLVAIAAVLVAGAAWYYYPSPEPVAPAVHAASEPVVEAERRVEAPSLTGETAVERVAVDGTETTKALVAAPSTASSVPAATAAARVLKGVVLDATARPAPNVALAFLGAPEKELDVAEAVGAGFQSGPDGSFECAEPKGWYQIQASADELATVMAAVRGTNDHQQLVVVVAPAVDYAGVVLDEAGRAVEGAKIELRLPVGFRARFPTVLDSASVDAPLAVSAEDGRFSFGGAPLVEGATLRATELGYEPTYVSAPPGAADDLRLVLRRPAVAEHFVEGVVVDVEGALVEGALVSLRGEVTRSDAAGRFRLDLDDAAWAKRLAERFERAPEEVMARLEASGVGARSPLGTRLVAVKEGHQPAVLQVESAGGATPPAFPSFVVLQLGPPPLAIEGRVLRANGEPAAGARVWVDDPSLFGLLDESGPAPLESLIGGSGSRGWRPATADEEGRFRLENLADRAYRVVAMDETLQRTHKAAVSAGSGGVTLRFEADRLHPRVEGVVRTVGGTPVRGATVVAQNDAFSMAGSTYHMRGEETVTDEAGRFTLSDVPKEGVYLRIEGEGILPLEYARAAPRLEDGSPARVTELVIEVAARCHLQVEDARDADSFTVLDEAGAELSIDLFAGNSRETRQSFEIVDGRSPVVAVPEHAKTVVLYRAGEEQQRLPLTLTLGEVTRVRP